VETTIEKSLKSQDNSAKSVTRLLSMFSDRRRELVNMGLVDLHADQMAVVVSALLEVLLTF
jgi:hypothetical protein